MRSPAAATPHHRVGLIGAGIATSLSPALHEAEAAQIGLSYRYSILDLQAEGLTPADTGALVRRAVAAGYTGLNITHPCKQIVMDEVDELSTDARALGAVNTIVIREGRLVGHNTDHSGFLAGLRHGLPCVSLDRVAVVGAGGAGSAVAYAILGAGTGSLSIADVDQRRVTELCERLGRAFPDASLTPIPVGDVPAQLSRVEGIVNATPIGMVGHPGVPFDTTALQARHWVADVVYRPMETELISTARAAGCTVLDGGAMLVAQAAGTFELVTGVVPDLVRMGRHLRELSRLGTADAGARN